MQLVGHTHNCHGNSSFKMSEEEEEDTYDDQEDTEADVEKSTVDGEEEEEVYLEC